MQELEKILEEIDKATDEYGMVDYINDEPVISKNRAKDIIRKHLSRENGPEITRYSRDNKYGEGSRKKWQMKEHEDALKEDGVSEAFLEGCKRVAQKYKKDNGGWIPVEERMPEDGTYLCTLDGELCGIEEPFTGMCGIENGIWDEPDCVIAWRPLPEPYRSERSNDEKK